MIQSIHGTGDTPNIRLAPSHPYKINPVYLSSAFHCYVVSVAIRSAPSQYILSVHFGCPEPSVNTDEQTL